MFQFHEIGFFIAYNEIHANTHFKVTKLHGKYYL